MDAIIKILSLLGIVFLLLFLTGNFLARRYPRFPWDLYIDKGGLTIYIPFISAIVLTVLLTILFKYFGG